MIQRAIRRLTSVDLESYVHTALFVVLALPLCVVMAAIVPLGDVPDEPAHMLRASSLLHGALIGHRELGQRNGRIAMNSVVPADVALLLVAAKVETTWGSPRTVTRENLRDAHAQPWTEKEEMELGSIAGYMPAFYVPSALAIGTVRLAGFGPYNAIVVGRLVNVLCFGVLGTLALLVARRGRTLMLAGLILPMTLDVAASFNQDGLFIAASTLAAALATRFWDRRDTPQPLCDPAFIACAGLIACIAMVKPPYVPFAALLMVPVWRPGRPLRVAPDLLARFAVVLLVVGASLGWTWLAVHYSTTPRILPPQEAGPLWPGPRPAMFSETNPAAQLSILLANPALFITLPLRTLMHDRAIVQSTIGVLGWQNVLLPHMMYWLWLIAGIGAWLGGMTGPASQSPRLSGRDSALLLAAVVMAWLGIYLSQYLVWSAVGLGYIEGPSGRYLLPLLPIVAVALPRFVIPGGGIVRAVALALPVAAAAIGLFVLPATIVAYSYVAP